MANSCYAFLFFQTVICFALCFGQAMLHFIYRDTFIEDDVLVASSSPVSSMSDTLAGKLLAAADKYGLERLRLMCESYLCKDMSVDSVASTLSLADRYHALELKAACLKFAAENLAGTCHCCLHTHVTYLFKGMYD